MAHATPEGLEEEHGALIIEVTPHIEELTPRGIDQPFLDAYTAKLQKMRDSVGTHIGQTSDKEQLTDSEITAKEELLADVRRMQQGAKRSFPKDAPQLKEFHVGEKFNRSTALLCGWAADIAMAWTKYQEPLAKKGKLLQKDVDTMNANAAVLTGTNASQEHAKRVESPQATAAALQAMEEVEDAADDIYSAAEAEYAKNPQLLGEFEKLKPLRYAVNRPKKGPDDGADQPPKP